MPVALAFCAHDIGSNLVGTLRDVDGDRAGGYRTLPVRRGVEVSVRVVFGCFGLAYGCALLAGTNRLFPAGLLLSGVFAVAALSLLTERPLSRPTALRSHEVLVLERILLAGAFLCLGIGPAGVAIGLVALAVAWSTQRMLRDRYESDRTAEAPLSAEQVLDYVEANLAATRRAWCAAGAARLAPGGRDRVARAGPHHRAALPGRPGPAADRPQRAPGGSGSVLPVAPSPTSSCAAPATRDGPTSAGSCRWRPRPGT